MVNKDPISYSTIESLIEIKSMIKKQKMLSSLAVIKCHLCGQIFLANSSGSVCRI